MNFFKTDIERDTLKNTYYRKVIYTDKFQQIALMSLAPGEDIPTEVHRGSQFIRVEGGRGRARFWNHIAKNKLHVTDVVLRDGIIIEIPPGTRHYVWNTSSKEHLKLYAVYSPPEHPKNTIHRSGLLNIK